jgi:hypothetical protein
VLWIGWGLGTRHLKDIYDVFGEKPGNPRPALRNGLKKIDIVEQAVERRLPGFDRLVNLAIRARPPQPRHAIGRQKVRGSLKSLFCLKYVTGSQNRSRRHDSDSLTAKILVRRSTPVNAQETDQLRRGDGMPRQMGTALTAQETALRLGEFRHSQISNIGRLTQILSKLAKGFFEAPRAFSVDFNSTAEDSSASSPTKSLRTKVLEFAVSIPIVFTIEQFRHGAPAAFQAFYSAMGFAAEASLIYESSPRSY